MMILLWRLVKLAVTLFLLLAVAVVAFVAWGNFWPAPAKPAMHCPHVRPGTCVRVAGRVAYHTAFGPGRTAHVVLLSRQSITIPGISIVEFPPLRTAPGGLGTGDWIVVTGTRATGSHHEHDLHVSGFATAVEKLQCGAFGSHQPCRRRPARGES